MIPSMRWKYYPEKDFALWDEQATLPVGAEGAGQGKRWRGLRGMPVLALFVIVELQSVKHSNVKL